MRILLFILISLGIGGGIWYYVSEHQITTQQDVNSAQNKAQNAADEYRKNQAEMMLQIGQ